MVRHSLYQRLSYGSLALIMALSTVPVIPSGRAYAEEGDCIDRGYKLQNWVADASLGTEATICSGVGEDFKASLTINRDLTIDLNGQTLLTNVVVNAGRIVTFKNGTLAGLGQSYTIFNKGGILTLEDVDVTVYGSYDALRNESGVATIDGGTYAGKINATGGQVTIEDGEFDEGLAGAVTAEGGKYLEDPTDFVADGKDAYAYDSYWLIDEEATLTTSDATVPVGTKVEIARVAPAESNVLDYVIKNSAGGDASSSVEITEEVDSATGEIVVMAEGSAQGRKEIDITNNSGLSGHVTLKVYEFQGVEDQVIFKGESLPMEISSNKWNITWTLTESSDENVATVDGDTVTAVASGKTTVTAQFNDTVGSEVTFDVYVYDFDEEDDDTLLIEKGASATVNTDSNWTVEAESSSDNVTLTEQSGAYLVEGVSAGEAELTFSLTVNGKELSKTVKAYVYEVVEEDVILEKGKTLDTERINEIINTGSDDVTMTFDSFGTEGVASNDELAITGESAGNTEVTYQLSVDGATGTATFNLHVWEFVTENLESRYELGNLVPVTDAFSVYDNNGTISCTVNGTACEEATDLVINQNGDEYTIEIAEGATAGTYNVVFTDTVFGQEVASTSVRVRVHEIVIPGEKTRYISMDENLLGNYGTLYIGQVREKNNYSRARDINYNVSGGTGLTVLFVGGYATFIATQAGSYTVTFNDGVAESSVTVHVINFTFGQNSYHIKRGDGTVIEAINDYWHEINVAEGYVDTAFKMVNDETGEVVAETDGYEYIGSRTGETSDTHTFEWCNTDNCLEAGDYTITFEAYANRGDNHGGKTVSKSVRLHIYEMVAPEEDLYFINTGDTLSIDVHDLNDRASTAAEITSGPEGGLEFATTGFWIFQETDYSRVIASLPGVYTVEYTDYMGNGAVVDTYTATIVVLEVKEEELFVRRGETVTLSGNEDWDASFATDDLTGEDYEAEDGEFEFDTTGMDLGEHYVYIAHDFSEFDDGEFPPRELVKVTNVVVYDVVGDENDDMEDDEDRTAVADFVAGKIAEALENDSMDNDMIDWFVDVDKLKSYLRDGVEIETRLEVYLMDESEWEYAEAYDEVILKIEDENGIVAIYEAFLGIYADGTQIGLIYELDAPITMRLLIPEEYRNAEDGYERTFSIIRGHLAMDDTETAEELDVTRDGDYLVFENAKFSSFTITYEDTLIPVAPDTGFVVSERRSAVDNSLIVAIATAITAFTLAGAAVFAKRK